MLIITIKQGKEKALLAGDPWIYLSAVEKVDGKGHERNKPGITAIVHAADDEAVMETLETLAHIAASVRAASTDSSPSANFFFSGADRLVAIAMRCCTKRSVLPTAAAIADWLPIQFEKRPN